MGFEIKTPRGSIHTVKTKNGEVTAKLKWNEGFGPEYEKTFDKNRHL